MFRLAEHFASIEDSLNRSEWQLKDSFSLLAQSRDCVRTSEQAIVHTRALLAKRRFEIGPPVAAF